MVAAENYVLSNESVPNNECVLSNECVPNNECVLSNECLPNNEVLHTRVLARGNLKEGGFLINSHYMYETFIQFFRKGSD